MGVDNSGSGPRKVDTGGYNIDRGAFEENLKSQGVSDKDRSTVMGAADRSRLFEAGAMQRPPAVGGGMAQLDGSLQKQAQTAAYNARDQHVGSQAWENLYSSGVLAGTQFTGAPPATGTQPTTSATPPPAQTGDPPVPPANPTVPPANPPVPPANPTVPPANPPVPPANPPVPPANPPVPPANPPVPPANPPVPPANPPVPPAPPPVPPASASTGAPGGPPSSAFGSGSYDKSRDPAAGIAANTAMSLNNATDRSNIAHASDPNSSNTQNQKDAEKAYRDGLKAWGDKTGGTQSQFDEALRQAPGGIKDPQGLADTSKYNQGGRPAQPGVSNTASGQPPVVVAPSTAPWNANNQAGSPAQPLAATNAPPISSPGNAADSTARQANMNASLRSVNVGINSALASSDHKTAASAQDGYNAGLEAYGNAYPNASQNDYNNALKRSEGANPSAIDDLSKNVQATRKADGTVAVTPSPTSPGVDVNNSAAVGEALARIGPNPSPVQNNQANDLYQRGFQSFKAANPQATQDDYNNKLNPRNEPQLASQIRNLSIGNIASPSPSGLAFNSGANPGENIASGTARTLTKNTNPDQANQDYSAGFNQYSQARKQTDDGKKMSDAQLHAEFNKMLMDRGATLPPSQR